MHPAADDTLRALFEEEAAEELAGLEALIPRATDPAVAPELYRHAHTIKGSAAVMGFEPLARLAKALEGLFDAVREGERTLTERELPILGAVVEDLRYVVTGTVTGLDVSRTVADAESALAALAGSASREEPARPASPAEGPGAGPAASQLLEALARAQLALMRELLPAPAAVPEYAALARLVEPAAPVDAGSVGVLVVEDSPMVREHHRRILADAGFDVRTAGDGSEALERLAERSAEVVVTDVEMPNLDGIALTEAIRARPELTGTRVVIVTSRGDEPMRRRGDAAGADDYLVKAVDAQVLLGSVSRALAGAR